MENKKELFNDDFEAAYLRTTYLNLIKKANKTLDPRWIEINSDIVKSVNRALYGKYKVHFNKVGFHEDDFLTISNMYMLIYMALYSLKTNPEALDKEIHKKGKPLSEEEVSRIDRNNMINFLKQKTTHCVTLFIRKSRNIMVNKEQSGIFAETPYTNKSPNIPSRDIIHKFGSLGYRKATIQEYQQAVKNSKTNKTAVLDKYGFPIHRLTEYKTPINQEDYKQISDFNSVEFYQDPYSVLEKNEEDDNFDIFCYHFKNKDNADKRKILKKFIEKNQENEKMQVEVKIARKMIKNKSYMV